MKQTGIILIAFSLYFLWCDTVSAVPGGSLAVTVVKGDTLTALCERYLEYPRKCPAVAKANRLKDPDLIRPGQILSLPLDLLRGIPLEGKMSFLKGDVKTRAKGDAEWRPLYLNDVVKPGSMIRTGVESSAELAFEDGTFLSLKPDSEMSITDARKKMDVHMFRRMFLHAGRVAAHVRSVTGRESRFEILTPSAVAAVRGTEFRTSVDPEKTTRSEVLHGIIGVQAMKRTVELQEGEGTLVFKDKPPMQPRKLLQPPALRDYQPIYKKAPIIFTFERIEGASSYRTLLAKDKGMREIQQEKLTKPDETVRVLGLEDGTYYMQSSSIDESSIEGPPAEMVEVILRVNPMPPIIQTPLDGAEQRETTVTISWLKVPDADRYHLQIAEDPELSSIIEEQDSLRDVACRSRTLGFKTYYFRVHSVAQDGYEGAWSDVQSFSIVPPPPAPPMEKPDTDTKEMTFRWADLGAGITYHFQMAKDPEFSEILFDEKPGRPMTRHPRPDRPGIYYIRTSSIDVKGYEGPFSTPQSFEIKRSFPYEVLGVFTTLGIIFLLLL